MAVQVLPLNEITKITTPDDRATIEMIRIIQQLVAAIEELQTTIADHEQRLQAGGL